MGIDVLTFGDSNEEDRFQWRPMMHPIGTSVTLYKGIHKLRFSTEVNLGIGFRLS